MIEDFQSEYRRYRVIGERALVQVPDAALNRILAPDGNSAAMIVRHLSGNLLSRFTGFLTTDGEKPWRDRDREFVVGSYSRPEIDTHWVQGWAVAETALSGLIEADLHRVVTIHQQPLTVHAALSRSLAHVAYHVGQLVLLARITSDTEWQWISIPKGESATYNAAPTSERGPR